MASVNKDSSHKFVIVLNEKSPIGKLLSATGQLSMSLLNKSSHEQQLSMDFVPFLDPNKNSLISLSMCSFIVLKGSNSQLRTLYTKACESKIVSSVFTSTMSYNGIEEDLFEKTANTSLDDVEIYGVALFGKIEEVSPLTKKFSVFQKMSRLGP
jgi:hypothetical protein